MAKQPPKNNNLKSGTTYQTNPTTKYRKGVTPGGRTYDAVRHKTGEKRTVVREGEVRFSKVSGGSYNETSRRRHVGGVSQTGVSGPQRPAKNPVKKLKKSNAAH